MFNLGEIMEWSEDLGGLKLRMRREADSPQHIVLEFDVRDRDLLQSKPVLKIYAVTQRQKDKWQGLVFRGGNRGIKTIFKGALPIDTPRQTFKIESMPFYDFQGEEIESFCTAELDCSGATGEQRVPNPLFRQTFNLKAAEEITHPKDEYDGSANFSRLPRRTKLTVYLQQALLLSLFIWTLGWGITEEIWEWQTKKGNSPPEFLWALVLIVILGGIYGVRKQALGKYISLEKSKTSRLQVLPGKTYLLSDVVEGNVEIDIENALFRIVCCNRERFQYLVSYQNSRDWTPRYRDFNGHVIYERKISRIPAGSWLSDHLPKRDVINFDVMFRNLYPQALVSKNYGVSVYWEVQIIHDQLVDLEIPIAGIERNWPLEHFVQHPTEEEKITENSD